MTMNPIDVEKFSNIQAEKALLGLLLLDNEIFEEVVEIINENHFFLDVHKQIFSIIKKILDKSQLADVITISNYASLSAQTKNITFDYLIDLTNSVISLGSYKDYANLIYEYYLKRQILSLQQNIIQYLNSSDSSMDQIQKIEKDVFSLAEQGSITQDVESFEIALNKALESAKLAKQFQNGISGVTTGLRDIDLKLGGMQKSDLIIIAGRPSMGKTALAVNIAFNCASFFADNQKLPGAPVAIFSLEMSSEQLASRILSSQIGTSSDALRKGMLNESDFTRLAAAVSTLKNIPIFIDDTPSISINNLKAKCRRLKRKHNIGLVVIDYIQLISTDSKRSDNRVLEVAEITKGLKNIAKELNIPVIALSQLSRAVESRDDKKPMLSDLRESGSIEQDADVVSFVFREEYYLQREKPQMPRKDENEDKFKIRFEQWQKAMDNAKNKATLIIAKNRHGPIGDIDLLFNANKTEFVNLDKIHEIK